MSKDIVLAFLEFHFFREYFGQLSQKADVSYSLSPISGGCFYLNTVYGGRVGRGKTSIMRFRYKIDVCNTFVQKSIIKGF